MSYNDTCPMCRTLITRNDIYILKEHKAMGKYVSICELIDNIDGNIIMYLNNDKIIKYVSEILTDNKITHETCTGSSLKKINSIKRFNETKSKVYLLKYTDHVFSKNIIGVDNIIFPELDYVINMSRIDEVNYFGKFFLEGQISEINIYYIYCSETLESKYLV